MLPRHSLYYKLQALSHSLKDFHGIALSFFTTLQNFVNFINPAGCESPLVLHPLVSTSSSPNLDAFPYAFPLRLNLDITFSKELSLILTPASGLM